MLLLEVLQDIGFGYLVVHMLLAAVDILNQYLDD